jgi:dienelactone hydrolase
MRAALCFAIGLLLLLGPAAAEKPLVVEETFLTVTIGGKTFRLEALFAKEANAGARLPVAIITHGQAAEAEKREKIQARGYLRLAREFARRGWLAAVVIRRGFGGSQGPAPYALQGCRNGDYASLLAGQTDDLEAAIKAIAKRADADASTVVALGISVGGAAVLDLAARAPQGVKAVMNVSGGVRTEAKPGGPATTCSAQDLIPLLASLGERSRLPTLWLYSENDSYFPPDYVRTLHEAYVAKGGRAEFHMFEPIGEEGHFMVNHNDGMLRWLPALDRFLRDNKLKTYDPAPLAAALTALNLSAPARQVANRYGGRPTEKVLAVSQSAKTAHAQFGGDRLAEIEAKAREECEKRAKESCRVVLRNFEVATDGH